MADYWIKLYHEILDDPKMATLPDDQWRKVIECFLIAGRVNNEGELPPTKQIAWILRNDESEVEEVLNLVAETGIIEKTETGWYIPKFARRQEKISGSDRTRMSRERKQKQQYYCNDSVTQLKRNVTENRTDIDIEQIRTDVDTPPQIFIEADLVEYQQVFEKDTGLSTYRIDQAFEVWSKMKTDGVTPQDMHIGTQELLHSDKTYTIVRPQSVMNAAYTAKQKRVYEESKRIPEIAKPIVSLEECLRLEKLNEERYNNA
jgi:hypothetical protein